MIDADLEQARNNLFVSRLNVVKRFPGIYGFNSCYRLPFAQEQYLHNGDKWLEKAVDVDQAEGRVVCFCVLQIQLRSLC